MGGQTLNDRILAAKHSLAGQGLAKAVCKATTEELIGPKKKHLDCKYVWDPYSNKFNLGCKNINFFSNHLFCHTFICPLAENP